MVRKSVERRKVLSVVGSSIASATLVTGQVKGEGVKEIIITKESGEPDETQQVPKNWYSNVQRARNGKERLLERYRDKSWFHSIGRRAGNREGGNLNKDKIVVGVTDKRKINSDIPDHIEGIPIEIEEREPPTNEDCDSTCGCIKGGSGFDNGASICCGVNHPDYGTGLLTAAHIFYDSDNCWLEGHDPTICGKDAGYVRDYDYHEDWALLINGDIELDDYVIGSSLPINGHVTKDGVDYLKSTEEYVFKYGQSTCKTAGIVKEITSSRKYNCNDDNITTEKIKTSTESTFGDSGGVHWRSRYGAGVIDILGVHGSSGNGESNMCPAYLLNNKYGITFGASNC